MWLCRDGDTSGVMAVHLGFCDVGASGVMAVHLGFVTSVRLW